MNKVLIFRGRKDHRYEIYKRAIESFRVEGRFIAPQPFNREIISLIDNAGGVLLSGGGDIATRFYSPGVPIHPKVKYVDEERDILEREAVKYTLDRDIPLFAICRGIQVLNWALGGDIYQDIDDEFPPVGEPKFHQQRDAKIPRWKPTHEVILKKESLIYSIIGREKIRVNSTHHQGVKNIAPGLAVTGKSTDGLPEVLEMPGKYFVLAVQFHPEHLWRRYKDMRMLFQRFADAVKNR